METIINQEKISQYLSIIKTNIENDNINGYYNIVAKLLELVYGYNFINTNDIYPNYPAIDLADNERRISVQVTSDNSIEKINRTFEVFKNSKEKLIDKYDRIIFFMIKGKLPQYDGRKIKNKGINFNKCTDIIDYSWKCMKCGNTEFEKDQFQATGGNFAKIFDVQNKKFVTVSCTKCGYTEIYKTETDAGMNILDFFTN